VLKLSEAQRAELEWVRDHDAKPHLRERAAALLKITDGMPLSVVARQGLLKPRMAETVRDWVVRYESEGLAGLDIRKGRGRKPAFSPSSPDRRGRV
jgi:transposase